MCFHLLLAHTYLAACVPVAAAAVLLLQNPDSWLGKKLLRRGVAHVGAWISQFQRLRLAVPGDSLNRQGLLGCSAQGSLLLLCPLWDEGMFRRLQSLQVGATAAVVHCMPPVAADNVPRPDCE